VVTNQKQAIAIQERRVKAGKRGYAKAVRRFANRCTDTSAAYKTLPVNWTRPVAQKAAA
jgi:hypothetical protein